MPNLPSVRFISDILKAMNETYVKSDKFKVQLSTPFGISNPLDDNEFLCEAINLPFFTYNLAEGYYNGHHVNSVMSIDYDPVTLTFLVDGGISLSQFNIPGLSTIAGSLNTTKALDTFLNWSNLIRDEQGNLAYLDEYAGIVDMYLLNDNLSELKRFRLRNAYPINGDQIAMARDSNEELMQFNISFKYSHIEYS